MFSFSFGEMALVAILALIFIGPKQLPEVARTVGRFLNDLKKTGEDLTGHFVEARDQVGKEIAQTRKAIQDSKDEVAKIAQEVHAIPTDLKATQNSQQAEVEKSQVSEGWRKHQIKSDISHLIEKTKQDNSNG